MEYVLLEGFSTEILISQVGAGPEISAWIIHGIINLQPEGYT